MTCWARNTKAAHQERTKAANTHGDLPSVAPTRAPRVPAYPFPLVIIVPNNKHSVITMHPRVPPRQRYISRRRRNVVHELGIHGYANDNRLVLGEAVLQGCDIVGDLCRGVYLVVLRFIVRCPRRLNRFHFGAIRPCFLGAKPIRF